MYVVTLNNNGFQTVINDQFETIDNAKITKRKNEIPTLTFDIYPNNKGYESIGMFETGITVYDTLRGINVFDGRILTATPSMDSDGSITKSITCEGLLGYLCDSRQGWLEERLWQGSGTLTGLQQYIDYILSVHNAHMPDSKKVYRGVVDVDTFATTDNVTKGTNFETTWEIIQTKLIDVFGGEVQARRGSDGKIYLDYCEVIGSEKTTPIKIGLNLESSSRAVNPNQLITRLYPRGSKLKRTVTDDKGTTREEEYEKRVDITSVNNGRAYIDDDAAMKTYGIIEGVQDWDDVTEARNLLEKAKVWLESNNRLPVTTSVNAIDLSLVEDGKVPFDLYNWHPVINPLNNINETLEIVGQTIDLTDPASSTIEFGDTSTLQSHQIARLEGLKGQVEYLESQSYTTTTNLGYYVQYTMSAIEVAENEIRATVGEQLVQINDTITVVDSRVSQVDQKADSISLTVSQLRSDMVSGQQLLESKIQQTADSVTISVTNAAKSYTDGQIAVVNKSVSEIRTTVNGISLSVTDGKLGSSASIKMTVGTKSSTGTIDMTDVRKSFANDKSAITISAGIITFNSNTFVVNSSYFKVTNTGKITASSGTIGGYTITSSEIYSDTISLYSGGIRVKDSSARFIGVLGRSMAGNYAGLSIGASYQGYHVSISGQTSSSGGYTPRVMYVNKTFSTSSRTYSANTLIVNCSAHFYANIDLHKYTAKNFWIDTSTGGAKNGQTKKFSFLRVTGIRSNDGTISSYVTGCYLNFKNGMLIGYSW